MPVNLHVPARDSLRPVPGVAIGTTMAGIRKANRRDVLVLRLPAGATAAGVFTTNRFCAAPVRVCREHLSRSAGAIRALVVNTGCANAGTGATGLENARRSCDEVARLVGCAPEQVLPFSTGVILEHLPMDRLLPGIGAAVSDLGASDWLDAAEAIMTTDTLPKGASREVEVGGRPRNHRRFSAQFQCNRREVRRRRAHDVPPDTGRTGEDDMVERKLGKSLPDLCTASDHRNFLGVEILRDKLFKQGRHARGEFARFDHRAIARS